MSLITEPDDLLILTDIAGLNAWGFPFGKFWISQIQNIKKTKLKISDRI